MDQIIARFPHLSEKIYSSLDNESLSKCKEVSRFWRIYLRKQKFFQVRIIKTTVEQYHEIGETWNNVFETASGITINALGIAVQKFYKKKEDLTYFEGLTPIHIAAATGDLQLLSKLEDKSPGNHPKDSDDCTPLYYAAQNGHLEVCEHILELVADKNPKSKNGRTPLHLAASCGHLEICELIMMYLDNKNPQRNDGYTRNMVL